MGKLADELRKKFKTPQDALKALGLDAALIAQDKKPMAIDFGAFVNDTLAEIARPRYAFDAFEESAHPRGKGGKWEKAAASHEAAAATHKAAGAEHESEQARREHKSANAAHTEAAAVARTGNKNHYERASQSARWASERAERAEHGHHADKAAHAAVSELAKGHIGKGEMKSSAELALKDAEQLAAGGQHYDAAQRAQKSLAYSVGIGHPDYEKATAAIRGARRHTKHLEVVPHRVWEHKGTGQKVSPYGALPYTSEAEKPNWEMKSQGHTIRDNKANTVGLGHTPFSTPGEAENHIDKIEARQREYDHPRHHHAQDSAPKYDFAPFAQDAKRHDERGRWASLEWKEQGDPDKKVHKAYPDHGEYSIHEPRPDKGTAAFTLHYATADEEGRVPSYHKSLAEAKADAETHHGQRTGRPTP